MIKWNKIIGNVLVVVGLFSSGFIFGNTGKDGLLASGFFMLTSLIIYGLQRDKVVKSVLNESGEKNGS